MKLTAMMILTVESKSVTRSHHLKISYCQFLSVVALRSTAGDSSLVGDLLLYFPLLEKRVTSLWIAYRVNSKEQEFYRYGSGEFLA